MRACWKLPAAALIVLVAALAWPATGLAHGLVVFASSEGRTISGWVNVQGGGGLEGATVQVFGPDDSRLGEVTTGREGSFEFVAERRCDHTFVVAAAGGHRAEYTVSAGELPPDLPGPGSTQATAGRRVESGEDESTAQSGPPADSTGPGQHPSPGRMQEQVKQAVESVVVRHVRPLREELRRYRQEATIRDVLAGIGFILGITGVAFYLKAGRKRSGEGS